MITTKFQSYVILGRKCPICLEHVPLKRYNLRQLVQTKCGHVFCKPHIVKSLENKLECPTCRREINENDIEPLPGFGKNLK